MTNNNLDPKIYYTIGSRLLLFVILVILYYTICHSSKLEYMQFVTLHSKEAKEVSKGIHSIYCRQGAPVQIISDNGTEFTNKIYKSLHEDYNCKLIFSTPTLSPGYSSLLNYCLC